MKLTSGLLNSTIFAGLFVYYRIQYLDTEHKLSELTSQNKYLRTELLKLNSDFYCLCGEPNCPDCRV